MPKIFILQINRSSDPAKPTIGIYAQGISAVNIPLQQTLAWEIYELKFVGGKPIKRSLSDHFIAYQRLWRHYALFLRRVRSTRYLLDREVGFFKRLRLKWFPPPIVSLYAVAVARPSDLSAV